MRLRLLIDVEASDDTVARLADMMAAQPTTHVRIDAKDARVEGLDQVMTGRFVGGQAVYDEG